MTGFSRRGFMLTAAAAAGATWFDVPRILADTVAESTKKYGGFPMGIQSYSLRNHKLEPALDIIQKDLELHYVEFFSGHCAPDPSDANITKMQALLKARDITQNSQGVEGFGKDHEANKKKFEFAKKMGLKQISADFKPDAHESLGKLVAEYDIRIAGHNHGPSHHWNKVSDILKQIKDLDPRIGACADLGHYIRSGEDPAKVIHELKGRTYGIHLKDFAEAKGNAKGTILGKGLMNVKEVFKALKDTAYPADGAISLEYEENPGNVVPDLKLCLAAAAEAAQSVA